MSARRPIVAALVAVLATPAAGAAGDDEPRALLVALDAVPFAAVRDLADPERTEEPIFAGFGGPVPLVSTFPSTTSLALGGILEAAGLERSPGYEHRFYDHRAGRKRGGGPISYYRLRFPWREFFDWQVKGTVTKGIDALRLERAGRRAVDELAEAFRASEKQDFHAYFDITDLVGHLEGPAGLESFLRHLDATLVALRAESPGLRIVVYSDHGLSGDVPLRNVRRGARRALRRAGWRQTRRLRRPRDVVFVPYGLVSSLVAFTQPGREAEAAEVLAGVEGIDFCVAADDGGWRVVSRRGGARVEARKSAAGELFAYRPLDGDPLGFAVLRSPRTGRPEAVGGFRSDRWWFEATTWTLYPDALYRIARAFDLVENPASLICSLEGDAMYGAAYTSFLSRLSNGHLRWTHGAMLREPSLGFVMSDDPGWRPPETARFDEALVRWLRDPGRSGLADDEPVEPEQQQGADDGQDQAPEIEPGDSAQPQQPAQKTPEERARDADQDGHDDAAGIRARHDPLGEDSDDQTQDDPSDDSH